MTPDISERAFEHAIERALLQHGPDAHLDEATQLRETATSYGDDPLPGSFHKRSSKDDYDRNLCLVPGDVLDFLLATQPKEWAKLKQHYGADVKPRFLGRLSREIARRGALQGSPMLPTHSTARSITQPNRHPVPLHLNVP